MEAKEEKAKAKAEKQAASAQKKTESKAAALESGSSLCGLLKDSSHITKLTVPQLQAVLTFKAIPIPKGARKADLQGLLQSKLALPSAPEPPLLALPLCPRPSATTATEPDADAAASGSNPPPEDESSSESSDDDDM